jgi:hypothetical protein
MTIRFNSMSICTWPALEEFHGQALSQKLALTHSETHFTLHVTTIERYIFH